MKKEEKLRLEVEGLENMKSRNGLSEKGIEFLEEKKRELEKLRESLVRVIKLKEGQSVRIRAEEGTEKAYMDIICHQNCILKKSDAEALKK